MGRRNEGERDTESDENLEEKKVTVFLKVSWK